MFSLGSWRWDSWFLRRMCHYNYFAWSRSFGGSPFIATSQILSPFCVGTLMLMTSIYRPILDFIAILASPGKVSPRDCPNGLVFSMIDERYSCSHPWPGACLEKPMQTICNRCLAGEINAIDDMRVLMKQSAFRVLNVHVCRPWFCFNIFSLNICRVSRRHIHLH